MGNKIVNAEIQKPTEIDLDALIKIGISKFSIWELWVTDLINQAFIDRFGVGEKQLPIIIDVDESSPFYSIENGKLSVLFNGRLQIPKFDKNGVELVEPADSWAKELKKTIDAQMFASKIELANDILKFTVVVPCISVPANKDFYIKPQDEVGEDKKIIEEIKKDQEAEQVKEFVETPPVETTQEENLSEEEEKIVEEIVGPGAAEK